MIVLIAAVLILQEKADTPEACMKCHTDPVDELRGSVHARETCTSCHGTDEVAKNARGSGHRHLPTFKSWRGRNLVEDCAACHAGIYESYRVSGHTIDTKAPVGGMKKGCLDCHAGDNPEYNAGGRAHSIPKANGSLILNSCRTCHETGTAQYVNGRRLIDAMKLFDNQIVKYEADLVRAAAMPGVSTRDLANAIGAAKRTSVELAVKQHGLRFAALEELRASTAGPLETSYHSQSQKEREFEGRWKYLMPFLVFVGASIVFVQLRARKEAT